MDAGVAAASARGNAGSRTGFPDARGTSIARTSTRRVSSSFEIRFAKESIHERRQSSISSRNGRGQGEDGSLPAARIDGHHAVHHRAAGGAVHGVLEELLRWNRADADTGAGR